MHAYGVDQGGETAMGGQCRGRGRSAEVLCCYKRAGWELRVSVAVGHMGARRPER